MKTKRNNPPEGDYENMIDLRTMHIVTKKDFAPVKRKRASRLASLEEMTKDEFDAKMARGLAQAKVGDGVTADEFFDALEQGIIKKHLSL